MYVRVLRLYCNMVRMEIDKVDEKSTMKIRKRQQQFKFGLDYKNTHQSQIHTDDDDVDDCDDDKNEDFDAMV